MYKTYLPNVLLMPPAEIINAASPEEIPAYCSFKGQTMKNLKNILKKKRSIEFFYFHGKKIIP